MAIKGAIIGDIIGSQYEFKRPKDFDYKTAPLLTDKCHFTDDTVLSLATKCAIDFGRPFNDIYAYFGNKYREVGYGARFAEWLDSPQSMRKPYNSYGNGSAMRVAYIADKYNDFITVHNRAYDSAVCTHNHPEGIKGAIVTATCILLAKQGATKDEIYSYAVREYPPYDIVDNENGYIYSPDVSLETMRNYYRWDETCPGSVPAAIRCVLEATNYTEFIRNVFSLKCDTDTLCAIGGGIAEELFDNSKDEIMQRADSIIMKYLDDEYLRGVLWNRCK